MTTSCINNTPCPIDCVGACELQLGSRDVVSLQRTKEYLAVAALSTATLDRNNSHDSERHTVCLQLLYQLVRVSKAVLLMLDCHVITNTGGCVHPRF